MCKMQLRVYGHIFSLDIYINGFIKTMTNVKLAPYFNATSDKKTTSYCCQPILHLYLLRRSFLVLGTLKLLRYLRSETNFLIPLFQKKNLIKSLFVTTLTQNFAKLNVTNHSNVQSLLRSLK